jgi:hypothetical protein
MTLATDKVCKACLRDYDVGKAQRKSREAGEEQSLVKVRIGNWWRWYAGDARPEDVMKANGHEIERELRNLLMSIANATQLDPDDYFQKADLDFVVGEAYKEDGSISSFDRIAAYLYLINEETANNLQRIVEIIRALRMIDRSEAKWKAEHFLLQTARGEIGLDALDSVYPTKKD